MGLVLTHPCSVVIGNPGVSEGGGDHRTLKQFVFCGGDSEGCTGLHQSTKTAVQSLCG